MAKKIVYSIEIDSTDAQGSIKRVEERLNELNQSANASQKEINTLQQELKELGQTNTGGAVQGVQSLRREYRRLIEELQQTDEGTEAFNRLAQEAGRVKDRIDAAQDSVNNFNKSPFENILGNFRQLRQRIFDLDFDGFNQSFKDLRTNLGNVATSFIGIQKGAGLAANGLKIFKVALAATGIGLLIAAITTLISNFDTLKESGGVIGNTFKGVSKIIEATTTTVLKLSDALGLTEQAYDKYIQKQIEAKKEGDKTADSVEKIEDKIKRLKKQAEEDALSDFQKQLKQTNTDVKDLDTFIKGLDKQLLQLEFDLGNAVNTLKRYKEAQEESRKSGQQSATILGIQNQQIIEQERLIKKLTDEYVKTSGVRIEATQVNTNLIKNFNVVLEDELFKRRQQRLDSEEKLEKAKLNSSFVNQINNKQLTEEELKAIEEKFDTDNFKIEKDFLLRRFSLYEEFGKDVSDLELRASEVALKRVKERVDKEISERKRIVDEAFSQTIEVSVAPFTIEERRPEDIKNVNEKISVYQKQLSVLQQLNGVLLEGGELEIENLNQAIITNNKKLDVLEQYGLEDTELYRDAINEKILLESQLTKAIEDENKKRLDNEIKTIDDKTKTNLQYATQIVSTIGGLTNQIQAFTNQRYDNELQRAGDNQEALNKIAKEQFETNKAFGIVSSIINTSVAIMNIWANSPNPIIGGILTGLVAAIGAAEIATIASQEFQPGTSAGSSFTPNQQGSQSLGSVSAMQPNVNFAAAGSGANIQTAGGGSPQSVQFTGSISVSEINNTQQLVNVYETGSLLGGG